MTPYSKKSNLIKHRLISLVFLTLSYCLLFSPRANAQQVAPAIAPASKEIQEHEKNLTRGGTLPSWVDTRYDLAANAGDSSNAPLVIRLSDVQTYVDKEPVTYIHRVMQANEASMLAQVGKIEIAFRPEYQKLALYSLHIVRGSTVIDKTSQVVVRFLQQESELDSGIFTGTVTASIVIEDIRLGDVVDIAYAISGQNPVFEGKFFQMLAWDSNFPSLHKRIRLNTAANRPIYHRVIGQAPGNIQIKEEQQGDRKIINFTAEQMTAIDFEPYVPSDVQQFRVLQFSEFNRWQQVNQWAENLFNVAANSNEVDKVLTSLRGASTTDETVQRALAYVQNEIRYLSISIGENSHRPFAPEVVLARRYGDCKDKSLLLVTLLRKLGIEAAPVLISTSHGKAVGKWLPAPTAFDHAIVRAKVNGKYYFLDPTRSSQYGPLVNMGQVHEGAEVLVVQKDTEALVAVPVKAEGTTAINSRIERVKLETMEGLADFQLIHQYSGVEAEHARYYIARQSPEQLKKAYIASVLRRYPNAELKSGPKVTDNRQTNVLEIELQFQIAGLLEKNANGWQVRYQPSNMRERFFLPENPRRTQPLQVPQEPPLTRYEFELQLPTEVDAGYTPSTHRIDNPAFAAEEVLSFKSNVLRATVELRILKDRVAAPDVVTFMADTRKLNGMLEGSVLVRKTDLKNGTQTKQNDAPLKQRIAEQLDDSVRSKTRVINDTRAKGSSAATALCERGLALARLGKKTDAGLDLLALQKENMDVAEQLRCKTKINYTLADFKSSEADAARWLTLGGSDGEIAVFRGMSLFALGKWKEAADSFTLAIERLPDAQPKLRVNIMRNLALRRLNPQAAIGSMATGEEDWLAVMLANTGANASTTSKAEDLVLHQAHKRIGDELDPALAEAYFYIAELNLVNGNKIKAMVYLQRSLDKAILTAYYRPLAQFELERLKK